MTNSYSGANIFNLSLFGGLVTVVTIIVVLIYGWMYGFNFMEQQVVGASRVLLAAHTVPQGTMNAGTAAFPAQPTYTFGQGLYSPAPQTGLYGYGYTQGISAEPSAGQYLCPMHGAVGLPTFDSSGFPHCPLCGQCMGFNGVPANNSQMVGRNIAPNMFSPVQGQTGMGNIAGPATTAAFTPGPGG